MTDGGTVRDRSWFGFSVENGEQVSRTQGE